MTFDLPPGIENELRHLAEVRNRKIPELVEEAVRQYLEALSITDVSAADIADTQMKLTGELRGGGSWQEIRRQFPRQWLLVEAIAAHSSGGKRVLDAIAVVDTFSDAGAAMKSYQELHHRSPQRELYVLHTDREVLDITEINWLGIRMESLEWISFFRLEPSST